MDGLGYGKKQGAVRISPKSARGDWGLSRANRKGPKAQANRRNEIPRWYDGRQVEYCFRTRTPCPRSCLRLEVFTAQPTEIDRQTIQTAVSLNLWVLELGNPCHQKRLL